jgi:hypothetical protein
MGSTWRVATVVMVLSASLAPAARAEGPEVYFEVKPPDPKAGVAPTIMATVIRGPHVPAPSLAITTTAPDTPASIRASKVIPYAAGSEPIAIAVVVLGQEVWMGNDDLTKRDDPARYPGALKALAKALDGSKLSAVGPSGSLAGIITYSAGAQVRLPMGPVAKLRGAALGGQQAYVGGIGDDLVAGVTMALAELGQAKTPRKAIIVIGDGHDTNDAAAKAQLATLKKQAVSAGIERYAIVLRSTLSDQGELVSGFAPAATVSAPAGLAAELKAIVVRLGERYYAVFRAIDPVSHQALPWDGKPHELTLTASGVKVESSAVVMTPVAPAAKPTP